MRLANRSESFDGYKVRPDSPWQWCVELNHSPSRRESKTRPACRSIVVRSSCWCAVEHECGRGMAEDADTAMT